MSEQLIEDQNPYHFDPGAFEMLLKITQAAFHVPNAIVAVPSSDGTWVKSGQEECKRLTDTLFAKAGGAKSLVMEESALAIPVYCKENKLRAVFGISDSKTRIFSQQEIDLFQGVKDQIALFFENKILKNELTEQKAMLEQNLRLASLGQTAAEIIHEINNPLSIIQGRLSLLSIKSKNGILTPEILQESIDKLVSTSNRISHIIKGVKSFSRNVEHDPLEVMSVSDVIEHSLSFCSDRIQAMGAKIIQPTIPPHLKINCRLVQISQVLINLINNALDANEGSADPWIKIVVTESMWQIRIKVVDSGNGIAPEVLEKMFQPFYTTKDKNKGTGLGLSISRHIIEAHSGEIQYVNEGGNTAFLIELPKV